MIKRITKLLNNKILLQHQRSRLGDRKQDQHSSQGTEQQSIEIVQQQVQKNQQQSIISQSSQLLAEQVAVENAYIPQDSFQGVTLQESNWGEIANLIHTTYYHNHKHPALKAQVRKKLNKFQAMYAFDLNNLDRAKIIDQRQFDLRSGIYAVSQDSSRYLQNDVSQNSKIGYSLMTGRKFKELIQTKNIAALKQTYRNNQYRYFQLQSDVVVKLIDSVAGSNFQTQFMLNLLECYRLSERDKLLKPSKSFERIIQNIHSLDEVNKLKFLWKVNTVYENGKQYLNYAVIDHELAKVSFEEVDGLQCQRHLRNIYSTILGKGAMRKLINYSINKFSATFQEFLLFWGLFNLLISRLTALNQSSIPNPHNLNAIFQLFELNFAQPKQILTRAIPEAIFQTNNKSLFQIYRVHAKYYMQKKAETKLPIDVSIFDEFVNQKIDLEDPIKITYHPLKFENFLPIKVNLRTSKNAGKNPERTDEILSETKMIEHLIRGDYNFVLNHFLLVFNPGLQKPAYNDLRKIIHEANEQQFTDQNSRALLILKKINEKFFFLSEPVSFRHEFLSNFKKIKWLQKADANPSKIKKTVQKMVQEHGKFSRKRDERIDPIEPFDIDNRQPIRSKPKKQGALFSKKNKALFSTTKDSYTEYKQVVKDLTQAPVQFGFNLDKNTDLGSFKQEVERKAKQMNQNNHQVLLTQHHLPIVGSGANLMKYLFLKQPTDFTPKIDDKIKKKLRVSFISQIGALQKDFSQYIQNCRFSFPLAEQVYLTLLQDQKTNYIRKSFKTIVTHMIAYRNTISDNEVMSICEICRKNRIGITLVQIYNLMIENKILVSKESIYCFCDTLQRFKKINGDIFLMTKKYCENIGMQFQIKMMSSYVKNLLIEEQDQKLSQLCEIIKNELKPKPYKLKPNLSADQNLKAQKQYKEFQKKEYNRILNQIINMVVLNVNNKLSAFVSQLFDEYEKTQTKLDANEIAISLIVYCNNVEKFLQIIRTLKAEPQKITLVTFECAIKALRLNSKELESHSEQIFNVTLFTHNFVLSEELIQRSVQIFKFLATPTVFIKFLEYMLRYNPLLNYEIKNGMYFVMNNINDDFAKNTISGLLDFIYNSNREKDREEYRKAQIAEEEKVKLLESLEKRDFLFDKTDNQKERMIDDIEKGKLEEAKKPKKNKSLEKEKVQKNIKEAEKEQAKAVKIQKPAAQKVQRRRIALKSQQSLLSSDDNDPTLKKSSLKKKLRNKSLNDFQQMFTKKEETLDQAETKGGKYNQAPKQPDPKKDGKNDLKKDLKKKK